MFSIKRFLQVVARPLTGRDFLHSKQNILGKTLKDRYRVLQELREGGLGKTYLAEDLDMPVTPLPRRVVKQILQKKMNPAVKRYFKKETEALASLNDPQIPILHAAFEIKEIPYIIQDFIEGHDLSAEIASYGDVESVDASKCWTEQDAINFLVDMLGILDYVHAQGIIHRDIKPSNIMRRQADNALILIDFGIVKNTNADSSSLSVRYGTQGYTPMEQWLGNAQFNSDIYALGMTVIQAVTGIPPNCLSNKQLLFRLKRLVNPALLAIIDSMVAVDYSKRCQSAQEALSLLQPLQSRLLRSYQSPSRFVQKSKFRTTEPITPKIKQQLFRPKRKNIFRQFIIKTQMLFISPIENTLVVFILMMRVLQTALKFLKKTFFSKIYIMLIILMVAAAVSIAFAYKSILWEKTFNVNETGNTGLQAFIDYNNRGIEKYNLNDIEGALADYNKAIEIDPKNSNAYNNRGNLRTDKLNDTKGALADYNKAIEIDPQNAYPYYNRGLLKKNQLNNKSGAI
jgi:eukaryotic-like serine/threonine-protein kinase